MMLVPSTMIEPRSGRSRPISDLRNTDLPVPDGPSSTLTSPARDIERDVFPDSLGPEGLGQSLNLNANAHARSFRR